MPTSMLVSLAIISVAVADLPVHCTRHQVVGEWSFMVSPLVDERSVCGHLRPDTRWKQPTRASVSSPSEFFVSLRNPNIAASGQDRNGQWTMIYDEGFEVSVGDLSFVAFSNFTMDQKKHNTSHCDATMVGWYRNLNRTKFGCWYGTRLSKASALLPKVQPHKPVVATPTLPQAHNQAASVRRLNKKLQLLQGTWKAREMDKWNGLSTQDLNRKAGLRRTFRRKDSHQEMLRQREQSSGGFLQKPSVETLPAAFDWGNVSGVDYLEPVMDQGECGSCYAASSVRMLTARHKIATKNASALPWSISFPLYCSEFNQGCDGGYGFLLARWSGDIGLLPATCMRYTTSGSCQLTCDLKALGKRWRVANHRYVGSFYGHSNAELMMQELYLHGPLAVGIEPGEEFMYYSEGIYGTVPKDHKDKVTRDVEWEQVDHGVLLVGWGEEDGQKYWHLQNSWGDEWGEDGFFRIQRGQDDSAIESMAEAADVVEDEQHGARVDELFARLGHTTS